MSNLDHLKERIEEKLSVAQEKKKTAYQQQQASNMEVRGKSQRFAQVSQPIVDEVILPRLEQLVGYFDNAQLVEEPGRSRMNQLVQFQHCKRFPVSAKLSLSVGADRTGEQLVAYYHLEILPVRIAYDRNAEISFLVQEVDRQKLTEWLDDRICTFVDTYLQLEANEVQASEDQVTDPVCGMRIVKQFAAAQVEHEGQTYYFCIEECCRMFVESPGKYLTDSSS